MDQWEWKKKVFIQVHSPWQTAAFDLSFAGSLNSAATHVREACVVLMIVRAMIYFSIVIGCKRMQDLKKLPWFEMEGV